MDKADRSGNTDKNGNATVNSDRGLAFNGANELIEVRRVNQGNGWNVKVGQYKYDADGIRVWRKTDKWDDEGSDKTVTYAYDRAGSLPYLIKDEKWLYVWGDGRLLYQSRHDGSGTQYAHTDAQGTLIAQTEMSREIKRRYPSDIAHPIVAGWPIYDQAIQYTGHISDSWEHGPNFNYMRSRYQEQATSRFLSRDTWTGRDGRPQSKNRYAYAEGNPASRVDPSGRKSPGPDYIEHDGDELTEAEKDLIHRLETGAPVTFEEIARVGGLVASGGLLAGGLTVGVIVGGSLFVGVMLLGAFVWANTDFSGNHPDDQEPEDQPNPQDMVKLSRRDTKSIDVHQIKKWNLGGKHGSRYDLYRHRDTGELWIGRHVGKGERGPVRFERTHEYLPGHP